MRKLIILLVLFLVLPISAFAAEGTAPEVSGLGEKYMPEDTESFTEGLLSILQDGIELIQPSFQEAAKVCCAIIGANLLLSMAKSFVGTTEKCTKLIGTLVVSTLLLSTTTAYISLAADTVREISDYGSLLVPVLTGALAAQGGGTTSAALYVGTTVFDSILCTVIRSVLIPMVYIWLILSIGNSATGQSMLSKLRDLVKWSMTWILKIALYAFTGYMGITKVISGSADAAALKATKLTISGMVPVIGSILSDASETVLVSAGLVKNSVGIYGLLAIAAMWLEPFVTIGIQYLLLKATAAICAMFSGSGEVGILKDFATAMGFLLAMTGAVCTMLLVSVICFMKGVA